MKLIKIKSVSGRRRGRGRGRTGITNRERVRALRGVVRGERELRVVDIEVDPDGHVHLHVHVAHHLRVDLEGRAHGQDARQVEAWDAEVDEVNLARVEVSLRKVGSLISP